MSPSRFDLVTLDGDTAVLGRFWAAALGLVELQREDVDRWIVLGDADGTRRIGLQHGRPVAGSIHLDIRCEVGAFAAEVQRLLALGAVLDRDVRHEPYGSIANLSDPQGNRFDLCAYEPSPES